MKVIIIYGNGFLVSDMEHWLLQFTIFLKALWLPCRSIWRQGTEMWL